METFLKKHEDKKLYSKNYLERKLNEICKKEKLKEETIPRLIVTEWIFEELGIHEEFE